ALYVPLTMAPQLRVSPRNPLENREARTLSLKGRLKPGVSARTARAELATIWEELQRQYPDANRNRAIAVRTEIEDRIRQDPEDAVLMAILMALAAVVLVIACANVANLMLGRVRARSREMAIRLAMGVSKGRLVRQLLTESLLLAIVGGVFGLAVAYGGIRFL